MADGKFIAYLRVNTAKQGKGGLGLEAQRNAVTTYLNGGDWTLLQEVIESESGKKSARPKLAEALRLCRVYGATLVVAKLDRLARNVAFLSALMDSGVDFVATDNPHATRFTIHILAAVAEHEAAAISTRTKAALAAAKARGVKLGGKRWEFDAKTLHKAHKASVASRVSAAAERNADLGLIIADIKASGATSLRAIADGLNTRGIKTARGGEWSAVQVMRAMESA